MILFDVPRTEGQVICSESLPAKLCGIYYVHCCMLFFIEEISNTIISSLHAAKRAPAPPRPHRPRPMRDKTVKEKTMKLEDDLRFPQEMRVRIGLIIIIIIIIQHLFCAIYLAIVAIQRRITNIYT